MPIITFQKPIFWTKLRQKFSWSKIWPYLMVMLLPLLIYSQVINFGYSGFDDTSLIRDNLSLLRDWSNWQLPFTRDAWLMRTGSFYRPFQTLSYMFDINLAGSQALGWFHYHNVLLFSLLCGLILYLLRLLKTPLKLALGLTLWVVVNPLFVHLVAWLPARGDLQQAIFCLLTFIFFIYFLKKTSPPANLLKSSPNHTTISLLQSSFTNFFKQSPAQLKKSLPSFIYLLLTAICFGLALFCKESALVLPVLLVFYFLFFQLQSPPKKSSIKPFTFYCRQIFTWPNIILGLLLILVALIWQILRSGMLSFESSISIGLMNFAYNLRAFPEILFKFVLPFKIDVVPLYSVSLTISGLIIIVLSLVLWFRNPQIPHSQKLFGWLWFSLFLLPSMIYRFIDMRSFFDFQDHRTLLPLVGILIFLALIWRDKFDHWQKVPVSIYSLVLILVITIGSVLTWQQTQHYRDEITFWTTAIKESNRGTIYVNRAGAKSEQGDKQGAMEDYNQAIAIDPWLAEGYNGRGVLKVEMKDYDGAIADYDLAILLNPTRVAWIYFNRAEAKKAAGYYEEALADYTIALQEEPTIINAYKMKALIYQKLDDSESALAEYAAGIKANPKDATELYNDRGILRANLGDLDGARSDWETALTLDPKNPMARHNLQMLKTSKSVAQ